MLFGISIKSGRIGLSKKESRERTDSVYSHMGNV